MFDADYIGAADRSNRCAHTRMVDGAPIGSDYNADILGLPVRYIESHQIRVPNLIQQVGIRVLGSESVPDSEPGKSQTIGIRVHGYRSVPDSDPCTWIPTCSE